MGTLPLGMIVEIGVSILLALTIGYCVVLNSRLKKLHADRGALRQMVTDLVKATNLANSAISGLRETANEADGMLNSRLQEADRFAVQLANHVSAGQSVMERIAKITDAASQSGKLRTVRSGSKANTALERLREYQNRKENAA